MLTHRKLTVGTDEERVQAAIYGGVFSNPTMLALVVGISAVGYALPALNAGGAFSCG